MNTYFKTFILIIVFYILPFNVYSMNIDEDIDENDINHAITIAKNILSRNNQLENGVNNIMQDHSLSKHSSGDSYFITDDCDEIKKIIISVSSDPDKFKFYTKGKNYRLAISKKIEQNIGYDEKHSIERSRVVLCFGINGMNKLSDSQKTGGFLTGFPARENYNLGQ